MPKSKNRRKDKNRKRKRTNGSNRTTGDREGGSYLKTDSNGVWAKYDKNHNLIKVFPKDTPKEELV